MRVTVDHEVPIRKCDCDWYSRIHNFRVTGFSSLEVHENSESIEDEKELILRQLDCAKSVYGIVGQESKHLVIRMY
jgi:hypothetical protein